MNSKPTRLLLISGIALGIIFLFAAVAAAWTPVSTTTVQSPVTQADLPPRSSVSWMPTPVADDPLVHMPGTQPFGALLDDAITCTESCHGNFDQAVEPSFLWKGSMMGQSARDFIFWTAMTVAGQDSIWAIGSPNAVDICERCHFPKGWVEGRSDPPNASAMTGGDFDGVSCDVCHRMVDPFFEDTYAGTRDGDDWQGYWDEANNTGPGSGTPSQEGADATRSEDRLVVQELSYFNGNAFYDEDTFKPLEAGYIENGGGQIVLSPASHKRASFADTPEYHARLYSRYHKSKYFCGSCHDVSNPVLANLAYAGTPPGDGTTVLPTEELPASNYFHVERTFSEFMLSAYAQDGGAAGIGPFAPGNFPTSRPGDNIATCQDCHMRDAAGYAARPNLPGVVYRTGDPNTTGSTEHVASGQPTHDLTGGNMWVPWVLASAVTGSPNYDATNAALLNQGAGVLTLDLTQGLGLNDGALLAAVDRAEQNLHDAAAINSLEYDSGTGALSFRIQNQTGHKLISGYPEGRRMFVTVKFYDAGDNLIGEINPYDPTVGTLKGLPGSPSSPPLAAGESYVDELVYEMNARSTLTGEDKSFHFALADGRYKDNRIPPQGFDIANAGERLAEPVWQGVDAPDYFSAAEYAGGYDHISLLAVPGADRVEVDLYYQTTSREYMEFLRDEISGTGDTLPDPNPGTPENEAYIIQTDPFFDQLRAWGPTLWQLWEHNKDVPGAAPVLMTTASFDVIGACHYADVQPNADHGNPSACDGDVDVADIQRIAGCWNQPIGAACPTALDINQSGDLTVLDITLAAEEWGWPE